jgi:ribosomal protein L1
MEDEKITENAMAIYNAVLPAINNKPINIKSVFVKLTMSPPVKIGAKADEVKK